MAQKEFALGADQPLRQSAALDQKEPMKARGRSLLVYRLEAVEGRHDVEQCHAFDMPGVIARQAVGDPGATVVPGDSESVETERRHRLDLVEGQGALRICRIVGAGGRFRAVAIAAQVGHDHRELGGQARGELTSHYVGLRVAVQQKQRRPAAAGHQIDFGTRRRDPAGREAG